MLQELGPRFTLRLRSLQVGLFGEKTGEYEFLFRVGGTGSKTAGNAGEQEEVLSLMIYLN